MQLFAPKFHTLVTGSRAVLGVSICLLWSSVAGAAPAPRASKPVCDPQVVAAKKLLRHQRSYGGPLKLPSQRALLGLHDLTSHISRWTHGNLGDENQAIQNDAPAARIDADLRPAPSLRVLGLLAGSIDPHPRTPACSPKSPRGPPVSA
jgi:hypothetical protein